MPLSVPGIVGDGWLKSPSCQR